MRGGICCGRGEAARRCRNSLSTDQTDGGAVKVRRVANRCKPNGGAERRARHLDLKAKRGRTANLNEVDTTMLVQSHLVEKSFFLQIKSRKHVCMYC